MMRHLSLALVALIGCDAGLAASTTDSRIRELRYEPNHIVTVTGKSNIQSTIEFGSDEHIESIAVGNSAAWQVTPNHRASLVFVKPLVTWGRTNMTVITDKRTYMFDLVTGRHEGPPIYSLKFSYPEDLIEKAKKEQAQVVAPTPAPAPPSPVHLNFGWKTKGAAELQPARVFDDGATLYLAWARNALLPAVSTLAEDGREASLSYRIEGEFIEIAPVPNTILLRYGKKVSTASRIGPETPSSRARGAVAQQAYAQISRPLPALGEAPAVIPLSKPAMAEEQVAAAAIPPKQRPPLYVKLAYPLLHDDQRDDQLTDDHHE